MFVKTTVFKKLIKQAYETRSLLVAGTENEYIISGNWWIIRVKKDVFSKKNKAAIIELTGEFPEEGEAFRPTKNAGNQYEIAEYCMGHYKSFLRCERRIYHHQSNL